MRVPAFVALIVGVILVPTTLGVAKLDRDRDRSQLERSLVAETEAHGGALESYFTRSQSVVLLTANSPAFAEFLAAPGTRPEKLRRNGRALRDVVHHLRYLEQLYPSSIGEACFIDADGAELARVVRGRVARPQELSTSESQTPFFAPPFALRFGKTHEPLPYVSPDTKEWVVANATLIPQRDRRKRAIVHFEVTIESFRRAMGRSTEAELRVVDGRSGRVVLDAVRPQRSGAPLGAAGDRRFAVLARSAGRSGIVEVGGMRSAYRRVPAGAGNANDWIVVSSAKAPAGSGVGPVPIVMLALGVMLIALAGLSLRAGRRVLKKPATT